MRDVLDEILFNEDVCKLNLFISNVALVKYDRVKQFLTLTTYYNRYYFISTPLVQSINK